MPLTPLPEHVQWLVDNRGQELISTLETQGYQLDSRAAMVVLMAADPSPGLRAVDWLCAALIAGGLRWEDVAGGERSRTRATLALFAQHRRALPRGSRNLEGHAGLGDLNAALSSLLAHPQDAPEPSGRELRRQERVAAYQDSLVIHQSSQLIVAVPLTQRAGQWWGLGTQWCTAAREQNMFNHYHRSAPLIVVVLPGVAEGKLQLHIGPGDSIQFMDVHDREVSRDFVHQHYSVLEPLLRWAASSKGALIEYMHANDVGPVLALDAVQSNGWNLSKIDLGMRTREVCVAAVCSQPRVLHAVPQEHMVSGLLEAMVRAHPRALSAIPERLRLREVCLAAVELDGQAIDDVPRNYRDRSMYAMAVKTYGIALHMVSKSMLSQAMCRTAVAQDGRALEHVPTSMRSRELCLMAVKSNGLSLQWVPDELADLEMCTIAVQASPSALCDVPAGMHTAQMCLDAVIRDGLAIRWVPREFDSPQLRMASMQSDGMALRYLTSSRRGPEIVMAAVVQNPDVFRFLTGEECSHEVCIQAIQGNPRMFEHVPYARQTYQMCLDAVASYGKNLYNVASQHQTVELCTQACLQDIEAVDYVPRDIWPSIRDTLKEHMASLEHEDVCDDTMLDVRVPHEWDENTYFSGLCQALGSSRSIDSSITANTSPQSTNQTFAP